MALFRNILYALITSIYSQYDMYSAQRFLLNSLDVIQACGRIYIYIYFFFLCIPKHNIYIYIYTHTHTHTHTHIYIKFTLEQATKAQRGSRDLSLLFL